MKSLTTKLSIIIFFTNVLIATEPFKNILLVINYNFPHYASVEFIKKLYKPYFSNIIFYGPGENAHPSVHRCEHHEGFLSYNAISDAMERYPSFDGYLFCMDDCIIHPWRFIRFDQSKIWFPIIGFYKRADGNPGNIAKGLEAFPGWCWWSSQWGCEEMKKSFDQTSDYYKKMLALNWGTSNVVAAYSDVMYIPKQYANDFILLAYIYGQINKSFLETALPTIVSCLSPKNTWEHLYGHGTDRSNVIPSYRLNVDFCHPLKLSNKSHRLFIAQEFEKIIFP